MFTILMTMADDFARFDADPIIVKAEGFPRNPEFTVDQVTAWLDELGRRDLVRFYQVGPDRFGVILNFGQRLRSERSKYPSPPADILADSRARVPADARLDGVVVGDVVECVDRDHKAPSPPTPLPLLRAVPDPPPSPSARCVETRALTGLTGMQQAPAPASCPTPGALTASDLFERFWTVYPKKRRRRLCKQAWEELHPPPELAARIVRAVVYLARTEAWTKEAARFVPRPDDFLRDRTWEEAWIDRGPYVDAAGRPPVCIECRGSLPGWRKGDLGRCQKCLVEIGAVAGAAAASGAGS